MEKRCEICGELFDCENNPRIGHCWCGQVPTTEEAREFISMIANDCVCEECLKKLSLMQI